SQEKVCVIFGCWTSDSRKNVLAVVEKYDHLLFYPVQYEGLEQSPHVVYTGAAPNQQLLPALDWWFGHFWDRRSFFLVGSDYVFPRAANAILHDEITRRGGEIVGEEYVLLGATDMRHVIRAIRRARPRVILNTINGDSNTAFFRALQDAPGAP